MRKSLLLVLVFAGCRSEMADAIPEHVASIDKNIPLRSFHECFSDTTSSFFADSSFTWIWCDSLDRIRLIGRKRTYRVRIDTNHIKATDVNISHFDTSGRIIKVNYEWYQNEFEHSTSAEYYLKNDSLFFIRGKDEIEDLSNVIYQAYQIFKENKGQIK